MKIVVTGGHHTTALAVLDELEKNVKIEVLWLGHKHSMWGDRSKSAEYTSILHRGYKFIDLKAGKFYNTHNPLMLLRIPLGFFQALYHLLKFKPDLILSFGGYLAVPVVLAGWLLRISSVSHEQTTVVGVANKTMARFVKKIFITWPLSEKYLPKGKTVLTGNPLRCQIFEKSEPYFTKLKNLLNPDKLTLYVTGGKQGAHVINEIIKLRLVELLKKYNVIHQCGRSTLHSDFEELSKLSQKGYVVRDYFNEQEIGSIYALSDLIISRAGANTVYEIAALGKVAIFIPIPWLPYDEQTKNAQVLVECDSAEILPQRELTGEALVEKISHVFANFKKYSDSTENAKNLIKFDAAERVVSEIRKMHPS